MPSQTRAKAKPLGPSRGASREKSHDARAEEPRAEQSRAGAEPREESESIIVSIAAQAKKGASRLSTCQSQCMCASEVAGVVAVLHVALVVIVSDRCCMTEWYE